MKLFVFLSVLNISIVSCSSNNETKNVAVSAQSDTTNKIARADAMVKQETKIRTKFDSCKTTDDTTFSYKGKWIPPMALKTFYTTDTNLYFSYDGPYAKVVDLDTCNIQADESCRTDTFCNENHLYFLYDCTVGPGEIYYRVICKNNNNIYCVYSDYCTWGGHRSYIYISKIFFVAIHGNTLLRLKGYTVKPNLKYKVVRDEIFYGSKHYRIPKEIDNPNISRNN